MSAPLTAEQALALLPQTRPCRFVDEVLELDAEHALTKYTWTLEDCDGHFPGNPVVPGVKMVEMALQTALGVWAARLRGKTAAFVAIDDAMFKKSARPGEAVVCRARFGKDGGADDEGVAAEVELKFLGGPKDGEALFSAVVAGTWAPQAPENQK